MGGLPVRGLRRGNDGPADPPAVGRSRRHQAAADGQHRKLRPLGGLVGRPPVALPVPADPEAGIRGRLRGGGTEGGLPGRATTTSTIVVTRRRQGTITASARIRAIIGTRVDRTINTPARKNITTTGS